MQNNWKKVEEILVNGGVAVIPTDTLYGVVASAFNKKAVERIYKIKGRDEEKPFIVLISSEKDLDKFKIKHSQILSNTRMLPKVSFILPCVDKKFEYLHRGRKTIAFRMVGKRNKNLFNLLKNVGPIVAPSANLQGQKPAKNISEAKKYFGNKIDIYINGGTKNSKPSTLVEYKNGELNVLRQGTVKFK